MKLQFSLLPITLVLLARMAAAHPPEPGDLKVTAPFDFVAEKHALSRSNYVLRWDKASNWVQICEDGIIYDRYQGTADHRSAQAIVWPPWRKMLSASDLVPGPHSTRAV